MRRKTSGTRQSRLKRERPCVLHVTELEVWAQLMLLQALYVGHGFGIIPSVLQSFFGTPLFFYPPHVRFWDGNVYFRPLYAVCEICNLCFDYREGHS